MRGCETGRASTGTCCPASASRGRRRSSSPTSERPPRRRPVVIRLRYAAYQRSASVAVLAERSAARSRDLTPRRLGRKNWWRRVLEAALRWRDTSPGLSPRRDCLPRPRASAGLGGTPRAVPAEGRLVPRRESCRWTATQNGASAPLRQMLLLVELEDHDGEFLPRSNLNHDPGLPLERDLVAFHERLREFVIVDHRTHAGLGAHKHRELGHGRDDVRRQHSRLDPCGLRGRRLGYWLFLSDRASPKKTAAKTKKTTPTPEESRVKSTTAMTRNATPAKALPSACFDITEL
jgi:hypothetical protein